jgi:hypothetical protein
MAATRVAVEFEALSRARVGDRRRRQFQYAKPGISHRVFFSLVLCFPLACMLWAAILYGAIRLAR